MDKNNLSSIFLKNFPYYADAAMAKEILEKNGIKSVVQRGDLNAHSSFIGWSGDADMFVMEDQIEKAKKILDAYFSAE